MKNTKIKEVITQLVREALTEKKLTKAKKLAENEEVDTVDVIAMDVPLFILMLEYSREDAQGDLDLHSVAERAIMLSREKAYLTVEDYDQIISSEAESEDGTKTVQENSSGNLYSNLQKEILSLIMKGNIEIKNYPNFKLSEKENTNLQAKGLIPSEIYKTTSGAEYLRFKVNDLKLEDELGKRFVDVFINKEVKARFKDIPSTSKYNDTSVKIYKKSRNTPNERSSD